ncbi:MULTISPECIES: winged helix-turn-helix domain-containing protein [unclassified Serratia (in: enterobacteria)]|uniref:winged helix-turn-helix domain-containing protein n=1 Tax=unclassified Serratia (in: enterobacteria) TaxID=2647522 RepID=UPI000468D25E|nr:MULTISPECIES: winged helix-turn-helix domain-containing protein [unclassified Serratia (in: enterobacteria)]
MDYLFDNVLWYRPNKSVMVIMGENDENTIALTPVLNRILMLLIEKKGEIVAREEFMENVWDNHGRIASSNTLTQYVSTLRKIFSDHLKEECIVTIPKKGYMLSLKVNVVELNTAESELSTEPSNIVEISESVEKDIETYFFSKISNKLKKLSLILLMVIVVGVMLYLLLPWKTDQQNKWLISGWVGDCPVYSLSDHNIGNTTKVVIDFNIVERHVKSFGLQCIDGADFFFYKNHNTGIPVNSYSLLSRCTKGRDSQDECITTKISGQ